MKDGKIIYEEKSKRILTTFNHKEPDRVPFLSLIETWAVSYSGYMIKDCLEDSQKMYDAFAQPFRDMDIDATMTLGMVRSMDMLNELGNTSYVISNDGTTIQHSEVSPMEAEDYDDLIADPLGTLGRLMIKKYPNLQGDYNDSLEVLKRAVKEMNKFRANNAEMKQRFKEEVGVPVLIGGSCYSPLDLLFDSLRGFRGVLIDIKRRPEKVMKAIDALLPFCEFLSIPDESVDKVPAFPFYVTMFHCPPFLSARDFQKFSFPHYYDMAMRIYNRGGHLMMNLEGEWSRHYDKLNEFPKGFAGVMIENGDIFEAKKKIGDKLTICGGMPLDMLKYGTKEECIYRTKKVIDECAPGGGFIFSTSKSLLSPEDCNVENLKAVIKCVNEYGKY